MVLVMQATDIVEESAAIGVVAQLMPQDVVDTRVRSLIDRFRVRSGRWIWEQLAADISWQDPEAWRLIASFRDDGPLALLLENNDRWSGVEFASACDITRVLESTWGFEFLITNERTDYFIAFNHHDYLLVSGSAVEQFSRWMPPSS
jgi:hypothetical protein